MIAHAGELTQRRRLAIVDAADDLRRYLDVATMRRDAPIAIPGDSTLQPEAAAAWCREAGMPGLAARLAP